MSTNMNRIKRTGPVRKPVTKQAVKDILLAKQECKQYTSALSAATANAIAGSLYRLAPISQGDNISNRNGDQIFIREIEGRTITYDATAGRSTTCRVIIFLDSMGSGGSIGTTELLETANFSSPLSAINAQRKRFTILYDKFHVMVGATNAQETVFDWRLKVNRTTWFNDNTVNATNIGKNAPYALIITSAANGDHFIQWRLCFTDS